MRTYGEEVVPRKIIKKLLRCTCDVCGCEIKEGTFEIHETTVSRRVGNSYPGGGSSSTTSFDICGECWESKLVPYLNSLGAKEEITEDDW